MLRSSTLHRSPVSDSRLSRLQCSVACSGVLCCRHEAEKKWSFNEWLPAARKVFLVGEFNAWEPWRNPSPILHPSILRSHAPGGAPRGRFVLPLTKEKTHPMTRCRILGVCAKERRRERREEEGRDQEIKRTKAGAGPCGADSALGWGPALSRRIRSLEHRLARSF